MALIIGITGGIGSGKTTIANLFKELNVPVYNADDEAKKIMNSGVVRDQILDLLGKQAYSEGVLNRDFVRKAIFDNNSLRQKLNAIVHPEVSKHFKKWVLEQKQPYILKEAAIIFEAGLEHQYDCIITVIADKEERLKRLLERPGLTAESIEKIMSAQWSDEEKIKRSDFVIINNDLQQAEGQVIEIHRQLLEKIDHS
jgi:dephospho-CoA kinase